jgi:hypothetical protein
MSRDEAAIRALIAQAQTRRFDVAAPVALHDDDVTMWSLA